MTVMSSVTGAAIDGEAATSQSVAVVLSTPIGTRVCRRDFGSDLPDLIDQPMNAGTRQRLLGATALALLRWMPWLVIERVAVVQGPRPGAWTVQLDRRRPNGTSSTVSIPLSF